MSTLSLPVPGIVFGAYPEKRSAAANPLRGIAEGLVASVSFGERRLQRRFALFNAKVDQAARSGISAHVTFLARLFDVRTRLGRDGLSDELVAESFALVEHAISQRLGYRVFQTQRFAAWIMLQNRLAEMATGEGKTVAASLCVATAALAGIPVHVITANDYLVQRDAQLLRPVYETLGLRVGFITQGMNEDQRRAAYAQDITYCTAKELVFDYLRDGMARREHASELHVRAAQLAGQASRAPVLRGLCMAVVDEADGIFIDEARTPLILAQAAQAGDQAEFFRKALELARSLSSTTHYRLESARQQAALSQAGQDLLAQRSAALGGSWRDRRRRDEAVSLALAALHLFVRDKHYLVRDGKVVLIDQTTGRVAPGRIFSRGIHQLLEVKEGCEVTGEQRTIAQITYQRFFPRYHRLCGMSGTLREAGMELRSLYGLPISVVPLRLASQRKRLPLRVFATAQQKWDAVAQRVAELHRQGRPILIGTDTVADSDALSQLLLSNGLQAQVLNARQDATEASVVAGAGQRGAITVATNMAGRGTDIGLGAGVAERGGLHVICCQSNASRRIDRQLHGRCARQGDPGSVETFVAVDNSLFNRHLQSWLARLVLSHEAGSSIIGAGVTFFIRIRQRAQELAGHWQRWSLLRQDSRMQRSLSFAGRSE